MSIRLSKHRRGYQRGASSSLVQRTSALKLAKGSLLLEAIIAVGIFAIFLGGIGLSLVLGERSTVASGDRTRAVFLAEQQLEAVRQMRLQNFSMLSAGTHGLVQTGTGWSFSGLSALKNGYRSSIVITQHATDWIDVLSTVS